MSQLDIKVVKTGWEREREGAMKTRTMLWVVVAAVAVVVAVPCWGRDIVVSLHNHTYYSDGFDSPEEVCEKAIEAGAEVVAINDHAEMINSKVSYECVPKLHFGVESWSRDLDLARQRCEQLGKKLIYGAEIGMGTSRHNHLLAWVPPETDGVADALRFLVDLSKMTDGTTEENCSNLVQKIRGLEQVGMAFAAAHPTHHDYSFCAGWYMDVYETFNHYRDNASTFDYIAANAGSPPRPKSIVAGADYHCLGSGEVGAPLAKSRTGDCYVPEMGRFTIARADNSSATSVLQAIRERRCYAAFMNARITNASCWPGGQCNSNSRLEMGVRGINLNPNNFFDSPGVNTVSVLAVNADTGSSLRWVQDYVLWDDDTGTIVLSLSRLADGGRWYVYLDISSQIVTSAITVLSSGSSPVVADSQATDGQKMTAFPSNGAVVTSSIGESGEKFVGREQWADGAITATYIRRDERYGILFLQYAPSGNIYRYTIDLTQNCQGLERCEITERVVMERAEKGRVERLYTDGESTAIQHMAATRKSSEYYILGFGYAFPAGNSPQARVGGVTGTPKIRLYRAQE